LWLPPEIRDRVLVGDADNLIAIAATATLSELLSANPVRATYVSPGEAAQRFDWKLVHTFVGGM
jgi:hypothetical protein